MTVPGLLKTEMPVDLDETDRLIVRLLQAEGRISNVDLAKQTGISAPSCLRRMRRLEETGIITGYHASTEPRLLGWPIMFFALVGLESQKESVLRGFEQLVADWPEVRDCHMIRGGGDFLLRVLARNTDHQNQLTSQLTEAANVSQVRTWQTIRSNQQRPGTP